MKLIVPITITDSMIKSGTSVAEPAAGETVWVSGATHVVGDKRIRVATHRVYKCAVAHSGSSTPPESDPTRWTDDGPTQRWAAFDAYTSTQARSTGSITYVLQPGFFNSIALYGLDGTSVQVTIKDAPGGTVVYSRSVQLYADPPGWYEYYFVPPQRLTKLVLSDLPIRPLAEVTVTVSAAAQAPVGIGMIVVGDMQALVADGADWGGTQHGATAEPVTYSYIRTDDFGETKIVRRHSATNARVSVVLPKRFVDSALQQIQSVLDVPAAWVAVSAPGHEGLNVFGLASARATYTNIATIDITIKGLI